MNEIGREAVLRVLTPIWTAHPDIARKLRGRIRAVLAWAQAQAHGYIEHNVAGEAIDAALPAMPAVTAHYRALPYAEVGKALESIEASTASLVVKACLCFVVLTACRSGEARGAKWSEIDIEAREWRIPASRMKANVEHRVPHGFRTSFRTWASEQTSVPHAVAEMALAHAVGSSVERSYGGGGKPQSHHLGRERHDVVAGFSSPAGLGCPASFARKRAAATVIEALEGARPASCSSARLGGEACVLEPAAVAPGVELAEGACVGDDARARVTRRSPTAPSGQCVPGVLEHRDQSGARLVRRADRLGKRQPNGPRPLSGLRRHLEPVPIHARHARGADLGRLRKGLAVEHQRIGVVGVHVRDRGGRRRTERIRFGGLPLGLAHPRHASIAPDVPNRRHVEPPEREVAKVGVVRGIGMSRQKRVTSAASLSLDTRTPTESS